MRILIVFCFLVSSGIPAFAQTGFFLTMGSKAEKCSHLIKSVDHQHVFCIPDEPIIKESEFKVEGKLEFDRLRTYQFFNLRFTKSGFETLKLICGRFPEKQLILVVNGKAVDIDYDKNFKPIERIPLSGKADSWEIKWIFENLKNRK